MNDLYDCTNHEAIETCSGRCSTCLWGTYIGPDANDNNTEQYDDDYYYER